MSDDTDDGLRCSGLRDGEIRCHPRLSGVPVSDAGPQATNWLNAVSRRCAVTKNGAAHCSNLSAGSQSN